MQSKAEEISKGALSEKVFTSLARTDDILAIIGVIILVGTIAQAFGGYWQGVYAKNQYIKEFVAGQGLPEEVQEVKKRDKIFLVVISIVLATTFFIIGYSVSKKKKCGSSASILSGN